MDEHNSKEQSNDTDLTVNFFRTLSNSRKSVAAEQPDYLTLSALVSRFGCQLIQGQELWEETLNQTKIISTGCEKIDSYLEGGIFTGELCEIFGPPGCGKTQFTFSLTANVLISKKFNVLYYDVGGSFSSKRISAIIGSKLENHTQMELREMLTKLYCVKVFNIFDLINHLAKVKEQIESLTDQFMHGVKLIIVDSINAILAPILGGSQTQGHALMIKLALLLKELSYENNIAVLVLNGTVTAKISEYMDNIFKPALGKHWLSVPAVRLFMDFGSSKNIQLRSLTIHKHNRLPINRNKLYFSIAESGAMDDVKEY